MTCKNNPLPLPFLLLASGLVLTGCGDGFLFGGSSPHSADDDDDGPDSWFDDDDDAFGDDEGPLPPELKPDKVFVDDVDDEVCEEASPVAETYFMSTDDSNSQSSPVQVRELALRGLIPGTMTDEGYIPAVNLRIHEFLNYYSFGYAPPQDGAIGLVPQLRQDPDEPSHYTLGVAAVAPDLPVDDRRPIDITFSVDTSCSMGGEGIAAVKATMAAVVSSLTEGDTVSIVSWSTEVARLLEAHPVSGPSDPQVTAIIDSLSTEGSTNLSGGLSAAYDLANQVRAPGRLGRVILLSDGGANTGETDEQLIAQNADDAEDEGIYLVGVLTPGSGYNDGLMNTVTDLGKGAYLYVPDEYEAVQMFTGERFLSNLEIAARNVRLTLTLPPAFVLDEFHGEEVSQDPEEVEPQHLAPNDAMLYHMDLVDCAADGSSAREFTFELTWEDIDTGEDHSVTFTQTLEELLAAPSRELFKADAIIAYAKLFDQSISRSDVDTVLEEVDSALLALPNDLDLSEVQSILQEVRSSL